MQVSVVRAAVYCRISEDRAKNEEGVDRQEEHCLARAEREGWSVARVWTDNDLGASTRSRKPRPQYRDMLAAAERGEVDVILGYSNSRLTRRPKELEDLISLYERKGVRIRTIVSGDTDLSKADGRAVARTLAAWDAAEAERTAERVADAARQRALRGKAQGGRRAFGFNADGSLHAVEADAVRSGIRAVLDNRSINEVAKGWDAAGLRTISGRLWASNLTNTRQVLIRWRNAGVRVYQGEPMFDAPPACSEIVKREELERLLAHLADRKRRTNGGRVALSALLGGIAVCGVCEHPLVKATHEARKGSKDRVGTYRCHHAHGGHVTIRSHLLDEAVEHAVVAELLTADLTASIESESDRARLSTIRTELAAAEQGRRDLAEALSSGLLSLADVREAQAGNSARQAALQAELEAISGRVAVASFVVRERDLLVMDEEDPGAADTEADAVLARFLGLALGQRRELIRSLLTIRVHPRTRDAGRIEITPRSKS